MSLVDFWMWPNSSRVGCVPSPSPPVPSPPLPSLPGRPYSALFPQDVGPKSPYAKLASRLGDTMYADMQGWKIYLKDMKTEAGGDVPLAQLLASQIGPALTRDGVDERTLADLLDKIPVVLGKKNTVALSQLIPTPCMRDALREIEDVARDL